MRRIYWITILLITIVSCSEQKNTEANYSIVPLPQEITVQDGNSFKMDNSTRIAYPDNNENLKKQAEFLSGYINSITGYSLSITTDPSAQNVIILKTGYVNNNPEAYKLSVNNSQIIIDGATESGTFYGIQTLRKSIPVDAKNVEFKAVEITDYPAYKHRGASLDVCRHFFSAEFVKKYIDVLAMFNMNVLHWHLTDDQGWRIEIKKYPKLTEIGSQREKTIIGRHTGEFDDKPHGGYYTQEEIKDIINYAKDRYITIIPEIDIPGHTLAVLASYPELGCTGGPYKVGCEWGIYEDVLCAGNEKVFEFLDNVFDEVSALFSSQYIHIGGDECLKNRWMACLKCQARIEKLGLKGTGGHTVGEELQSYFIARVEKMLNAKGKSIIGWDEILEGGIAPNATIMSWRGTEGGTYAASKGHNVIMTPEQYVYLDYYQSPDVDNEPFTYGWLTELKKTYSFDPMPEGLSEDNRKHILGAQVNIWAEYMPTSKNVEYMLLPRMCALAETVWTNPKKKDYNEFVARLYNMSKHLDKLGYENCKQAYGVQDSVVVDTIKNEVVVYLSTFDNNAIHYSTEGKQPDMNSTKYENPIIIKADTDLTAVTYRDNSGSKVYEKNFIYNKAFAKPISLRYAPDKRYTFNGATTLVDGQDGSEKSYRTGQWIGFLGTDFEAVIDLKELTDVSSVEMNFMVNTRGNLFQPKSLAVFVSQDGKNYEEVYKELYTETSKHVSPTVLNLSATVKQGIQARYVKIIAESIKTLPEWHEKKGDKAYLMIDELKIF